MEGSDRELAIRSTRSVPQCRCAQLTISCFALPTPDLVLESWRHTRFIAGMNSEFEAACSNARAALEQADAELLRISPSFGRKGIVLSLDKELYGVVYHGNSPEVRTACLQVLRARRDHHVAVRHGFTEPREPFINTSADMHEWYAQLLTAVLLYIGDARPLPPHRHWSEFLPEWDPDTSR